MTESEGIDFQLDAQQWAINEAKKLLNQYKEAKTEHERNRIFPKLTAMKNKLYFEGNENRKLIGDNYDSENRLW